MLDAALELASCGGYDALQVRAVAERAGVSSRTIYENFQSLDSLVIVAVTEQTEWLYRRFWQFTEAPREDGTAAERVNQLIHELTESMTANRELTVSLLRALLSGKPDVAQYIRDFQDVLKAMLTAAIAPGHPSTRDREVAEILASIWFTALAGWASGADVDAHIGQIMQRSTRLLLAPRDEFGNQGFGLVNPGYDPPRNRRLAESRKRPTPWGER